MKTTAAQFKLFKEHSEKWRLALGLNDWYVYYSHEKAEGTYARTRWDNGSQIATIILNTTWDVMRPLDSRELDRVALHEMLHVAMADIVAHAESRYITEDGLEQAEHRLIRRMEYALFEHKEWGKLV